MSLDDSCWLWNGSYFSNGYGQVWSAAKHRATQAHRFVYESLVGPIANGLQLDHLCRRQSCVNPAHLRQVTARENILAPHSTCLAKINADMVRCKRGHEFTYANTYHYRGRRLCRTCRMLWKRERKAIARRAALGVSL